MSRQWNGTDLKRLHRSWARRSPRRVAVILDGVGTPYNVGSIVRTAAAYKVDQLWCAGAAAATPSHPGARKTALGTERYLPWSAGMSAVEAVAEARQDGYGLVLGIELADGAVPLHEMTSSWHGDIPDLCIVLGHEDHGLGHATTAVCDGLAFLPQLGRVGSLNVATAAALALYEVRRYAWTAGPPSREIDTDGDEGDDGDDGEGVDGDGVGYDE